jgi:hypothetical protein
VRAAACARARARIPFYLEGEVQPYEALETASHLATCDRCTEEVAKGQEVLDALRDLQEPEPPGDIAAGIVSTLRRLRDGLTGPVAGRAALKWGALGFAAIAAALHFTTGISAPALGVRMVCRLGEMLNLESLIDRALSFVGRFIPSPAGTVLSFLGIENLPAGHTGPLLSPDALAILLVTGASLSVILSVAALGRIARNRLR